MSTSLLVSIITVVYNGDKYLQQTIDSVYNQSFKNIEYIIVDGGSTDNTINIIKNNLDKITKWVSEPDKGLYDAMNKGIGMASGNLIGTINSDDWYELNAVELIVSAYLREPSTSLLHANRYDVYPGNTKKEYKFNASSFKFKYFSMTYSHPSIFVKKEVYDKYNYNTSFKSCSDYLFVLQLYLDKKINFAHVAKPIVNFRLGGISGQIGFFEELKEFSIARRIAKMSFFEVALSYILVLVLRPAMRILKNKI